MISQTPFKVFGLLLISFFLLSCDKKPTEQKVTEAAVLQADQPDLEKLKLRALARWNALIESEWTTAYSYQTPSYRKNYTKKDFINSFGSAVGWKKIEYGSLNKINDELVDITLVLNISIEAGSDSIVMPTNITERWQFSDNNWWHVNK